MDKIPPLLNVTLLKAMAAQAEQCAAHNPWDSYSFTQPENAPVNPINRRVIVCKDDGKLLPSPDAFAEAYSHIAQGCGLLWRLLDDIHQCMKDEPRK